MIFSLRNLARTGACVFAFGAFGRALPDPAPAEAPVATPVAVSAPPDAAAVAPAAAQAPLTERRVYDLWAEHEYQSMIVPYKASAFADPKWDGQVDELFRISGKNFALRAAHSDRQVELVKGLMAAGCKDPLVASMAIGYQLGSNAPKSKLGRAIEDSEELLETLRTNNYSKIRQWRIAVFILSQKNSIGETRSQLAAASSLCEDTLVAAASEPGLSPMAERLILDKFKFDLDSSVSCYSRAVCDKISASSASAWMKGSLLGEYHLKEAWKRRGTGWAGEVNDAGWKGFASELAESHDGFLAAYRADPSRPEPPSQLIRVVAASHDFPNETEAMWFDRAVKAQFDHANAYLARRWFLRPRWGGSHEEMLRLAEGWAASKRFDTRVPEMYLWTLDDICEDRGEYESIWQQPGVLATVEAIRDGYLAQKDPYFNTILSRIAHMFWLAGKRAEANDLVDRLSDGFVPGAGSAVRVYQNEFSAVHAYAPAIRAAALAADEAADLNNFDKAVTLLTEAKAAHADLPESAAKAVDRAIELFKFRKQFASREWTSILLGSSPEAFFESSQSRGAWVISNDSIKLAAKNSWWGDLRFIPKVGKRYELRSRIVAPADGQSEKCQAGFMIYHNVGSNNPYWQSVMVAPLMKTWSTGVCWDTDDSKPMESGNPVDLLVKVWDDEVVIRIDGNVVYAGSAVRPDRVAPLRDQLGFCALDHDPASAPVEFREPAVRLLQARPSELGKIERPVRRPRDEEEIKPRF
ncbi:MAG: hypothetical protein JNM86_02045 [Phycisphaerae bacterium]|nr:hypothetical protein [Phycisphaerae bacterium]